MFRKSRIFMFGLRHAIYSGWYVNSQPFRSDAHKQLLELSIRAIEAITANQDRQFLTVLDDLIDKSYQKEADRMAKEITDWLYGKSEDIPDWLRK